jgi:putative DNA methylase
MTVKVRKKLIEVALPLEAINKESLQRKQKAPKGWPTSFHKWWAQRPLAAARAVIFAQMVDDPSSSPDLFPTEERQARERDRLFGILKDLVKWDNTDNEHVVQRAQEEIWQSWRRTCAENADHPQAARLFDRHRLPAFLDPFAGAASIPLSAQWLGLECYAADLNPVAVLMTKALIEIPWLFADVAPVNPASRKGEILGVNWRGATGLAQDVEYYSRRIKELAEAQIGSSFPNVEITPQIVAARGDLRPFAGQKLRVVAWIWARTVKSPNPAFADVDVPLASTFLLSSKTGKESYVEPLVEGHSYQFSVRSGRPSDYERAKLGTKLGRGANFRCLMSGTPIPPEYIKEEGKAGRLGVRMMALVAEGIGGRVYLAPTAEQEEAAREALPAWRPEVAISGSTQYLGVKPYGMDSFDQLFTPRQLLALGTFAELVEVAASRVREDALAAGMSSGDGRLGDGGRGAEAYADAVAVYLACIVDRMVFYNSALCGWLTKDNAMGKSMPQQALAMSWDFAEANPFAKSSGDITTCTKAIVSYLDVSTARRRAIVEQRDAQSGWPAAGTTVVSTDPPYYDNVPYSDLSDFFYVWLRRALRGVYPNLFSTVTTPKARELVAFAYRHKDGKVGAERFFLKGMKEAIEQLRVEAHPAFPITIYYAFKQAESDAETGTASTGWEVFLEALMEAGLSVYGTWPLRTEGEARMRGMNSNALASSIVLVCRPRDIHASSVGLREFISDLKSELPDALRHLQAGNIAPVDLAQAAIGPGMGVYTRYSKVLGADGQAISVREALAHINRVLDEVLADQEGDFDADSRWALAWFEQNGFAEADYGLAETLSKAKNTSVEGLAEAGVVASRRGKVRLLTPQELPMDWDPATDTRLTAWEAVHHLIRVLESGGEGAASVLAAKLGSTAETARELAYRLYTLCERKKRASEALAYNGLVQSWPEIRKFAAATGGREGGQADLFEPA